MARFEARFSHAYSSALLAASLLAATSLDAAVAAVVGAGALSTSARGIAAASASDVTPIPKVLELLNDMLVKGKAEKAEEETRFAAFSRWCVDRKRAKESEIHTNEDEMEHLNARIEKDASSIRGLSERIYELDEDVARWRRDLKSTAEVRGKEASDFRATSLDYSESVDALDKAITVLKREAYSRPQAQQALLQVGYQKLVPESTKAALAAFLQQAGPDEMLFREAPEAYGYEFQSGGVVAMLEKLADEFTTKKRELEAEELHAQHAYELIAQQLNDNIENAEHESAKKNTLRGDVGQSMAEAKGDLAQSTKDRDEDLEYLQDMTALCQHKTADYESRQKLRVEEIIALGKAIEVISSYTVAGAGEKYLTPSFLQRRPTAVALGQLRAGRPDPSQERAAEFLSSRARGSGSRLLQEVARRAAADPFSKVKKMIKDLIGKLMEEGTSETEHKGWCDAELATNKQTRDARTQDISRMRAEDEETTAEITHLTQELADLADGIKELNEAMATQTSERQTTKAANEKTIKEAKEAQVAVEHAIAVLKEFYAKSAEATSFVQQTPLEDAPETFDKPYQGLMPDGGNVVDFLSVILSDFARLESDTSTSEMAAQDDYEKFMFEARKDKALKETDVTHKTEKRTDKESALHSLKAELEATQKQLDTAIAYYDKLKPTCVDSGVSFEERVRSREEEIQSLKEALQILTGQDLPTLS